MVITLIYIILATIIVSLISLIGVITLSLKDKLLSKITVLLVSLSIGGLLGGAFFHLIPEASSAFSIETVFIYVLVGFLIFFIIEKILHWRHCHEGKCEVHNFAYLNLFGDSIHNFMDGLIIAGSFLVNFNLGIATSLAIIIHEIPQEFGDFGVLIYAGFSKKKAILSNFLIALTAILGGITGFFVLSYIQGILPFIVAIGAGGFIYIAASDLIPELQKETNMGKAALNLIFILIGLVTMYFLKFLI